MRPLNTQAINVTLPRARSAIAQCLKLPLSMYALPNRGLTRRLDSLGPCRRRRSSTHHRPISRKHGCYGLPMLVPGDPVPDVQVWTAPREEARPLKEVLGAGLSLLCFYLWDWSPT